MSRTAAQPVPSPEPVFPLSVEQYHQMIESGVLTPDDPVELIEGILVYKMPKKPKHRFVLRKLEKALQAIVPPGFQVQIQEPITLSDGEPEPDASIFRGTDEDYADRHPGPADVPLVIEVSDTTLARDRGMKLRSYARAGIAMYWIIDLVADSIEVCADPDPKADEPTYRNRKTYTADAKAPVELAGKVVGGISIQQLLP